MINYRCEACGVTWCRLWRQYQTVAPRLLCANCVERDQGEMIDPVRPWDCGWFVLAVPDEDFETYWGYTAVPQAALARWNALPARLGTERGQ